MFELGFLGYPNSKIGGIFFQIHIYLVFNSFKCVLFMICLFTTGIEIIEYRFQWFYFTEMGLVECFGEIRANLRIVRGYLAMGSTPHVDRRSTTTWLTLHVRWRRWKGRRVFNRGRGDRGAGCWGERVAFFPNPGNLAALLRGCWNWMLRHMDDIMIIFCCLGVSNPCWNKNASFH